MSGADAKQDKGLEEQLLPLPLHVHAVKIEGNEWTHSDFIDSELRAAGLYSAKTLREVATRAAIAQNELRAMGLFESVAVSLDSGPRATTLGAIAAVAAGKDVPNASAAGAAGEPTTDVTVRVKERKRLGARAEIMTDVQTGERTLRLAGSVKNAFGRGEVVEGSVSSSDNGSTRGFGLSLTKPKFAGRNLRLRIGAFDITADSSRFSSYAAWSRGIRMSLTDNSDRHELGYEAAYREVRPQASAVSGSRHSASVAEEYIASPSLLNVSQPASAVIVAHSHPSFKSALSYRFTVDKRDDKAAPSKGSYFSLKTELAGLGGDVDYAKAEVEAQHHIALTPRVSVGASVLGGAIRPFSLLRRAVEPHRPRVNVVDRFFLGGPLALRGYGAHAIGPHDTHDALGGDTYAAAGVNVSYLLPWKVTTEHGVRVHAFGTAGNLIAYDEKASAADNAKAWRAGVRVSVGGGLVVPTPLGRFELNLVKANVPLPGTEPANAATRTHGLQVGLGYQFL